MLGLLELLLYYSFPILHAWSDTSSQASECLSALSECTPAPATATTGDQTAAPPPVQTPPPSLEPVSAVASAVPDYREYQHITHPYAWLRDKRRNEERTGEKVPAILHVHDCPSIDPDVCTAMPWKWEWINVTERVPYFWDHLPKGQIDRKFIQDVVHHVGDDDQQWIDSATWPNPEARIANLTSSPSIRVPGLRTGPTMVVQRHRRVFLLEVDDVFIETNTGTAWRRERPYLVWEFIGCKQTIGFNTSKLPNPPHTFRNLSEPVFIVPQWPNRAYFHAIIESSARIAPWIDLVRAQDMLVLSPAGKPAQLLQLAGVKEKNILPNTQSQFLWASKAFIPMASSCGFANIQAIRLWNQMMVNLTRTRFLPLSNRSVETHRTVLVIKRTPGVRRAMINHDDFMAELQANCREEVVEFFGNETWEETALKFYAAKVIVGPHGAGFTNLIFSRPDTKVVEVLLKGAPNYCYAILASHLNLEYHGLYGANVDGQIMAVSPKTVNIVLRALARWHTDHVDASS